MRKRLLIGAYVILLGVSSLARWLDGEPPPAPESQVISAPAFIGDTPSSDRVRLAYRTFDRDANHHLNRASNTGSHEDFPNQFSNHFSNASRDRRPVVVLLHGSPGQAADFARLASHLQDRFRLLAPDLAGFGDSSRQLPDYSIRAQAHYVVALLDRLAIERAHFVGFSMGGGVALHITDLQPERVQSLTLLAAIGAQEMELLGDYHLNHALHGLQLAALWLLREATPHFGYLDRALLGVEYARNFYDTDQRPLREVLSRLAAPTLILHGERDMLVPVEAAREHHRLAPQSELQVLPAENHFTVFVNPSLLVEPLTQFINKVEAGRATTRAAAEPARLAAAAAPFDIANLPKAKGVAALVFILLLAAATLVSEDLTCIGAGVMAAQGRLDLLAAIAGCFLGIFVGDVLLYVAGRTLGRPALRRAPLKWFIRARDVERGSAWLERRGLAVIATSRFVPGMRLPTYFAAGLLQTKSLRFALYFLLASAVWTPLLVCLSFVLGDHLLPSALLSGQHFFVKILVVGLLILFAAKFLLRLATWRGRRMLVAWWRRKRHWEFWSPFFFYPPVVVYILLLAIRHRSLTLFTAANPGIIGGGFIGESKSDILQNLSAAGDFIARHRRIPATLDAEARFAEAERFMQTLALDFPVVLKPDLGQRGSGVAVIRSAAQIRDYLSGAGKEAGEAGDIIIQEYAPGAEFGVFYYRYPDSASGRIFAITEKRFPVVIGDGKRRLEQLILQDERAVCMAKFYLEKERDHLSDIPAAGERRQLVEIGTHCRGAIFLDGGWAKTEALEAAIDDISKTFTGFYFGRYDIRTPSVEDFQQGRNFKVVELNGVTSEATNIYDPKNRLFAAYRILFAQWRLAFAIGEQNRKLGVQPASVRALIKLIIDARR